MADLAKAAGDVMSGNGPYPGDHIARAIYGAAARKRALYAHTRDLGFKRWCKTDVAADI